MNLKKKAKNEQIICVYLIVLVKKNMNKTNITNCIIQFYPLETKN